MLVANVQRSNSAVGRGETRHAGRKMLRALQLQWIGGEEANREQNSLPVARNVLAYSQQTGIYSMPPKLLTADLQRAILPPHSRAAPEAPLPKGYCSRLKE